MSERETYHKGWCPTLTKPMESGDGLLVRINLPEGCITPGAAGEVARLAATFGNGQLDVTSRRNLQIRGVRDEEYPTLAQALLDLGFTDEARPPKQEPSPALPELGYTNDRLTLGLLFGRLNAAALAWLAVIAGDQPIHLGSQRTVTLNPISTSEDTLAQAEAHGFITQTHDSRRFIEACPGAPACKSAEGDTRALALAIAKHLPDLSETGQTIHVSGCIKGCACARQTARTITARFNGYAMAINAKADEMPLLTGLSAESVLQILTEWEHA